MSDWLRLKPRLLNDILGAVDDPLPWRRGV